LGERDALPGADVHAAREQGVTDLYAHIDKRGFHFPREIVSRYLLSLKTKPFIILSGISGTGKTKLAQLAAEYYNQQPTAPIQVHERPVDSERAFYLPVTQATLTSGTIRPSLDQYDYFNPSDVEETRTLTVRVENVLGATGDQTIRINNRSQVSGAGREYLSISLPMTLRKALVDNGVTPQDYLRFEIIEEFKRFSVMLYRPELVEVVEPPEFRYAFVSVQPDWHNNVGLLGAYDPDTQTYERAAALELILRAHRSYTEALEHGTTPPPYFLILDEMNLARIEHYFSDFLSVLESRRYDDDGRIVQERINLHNLPKPPVWIDEIGVCYEIPSDIEVPPNVLFVGTVNLDETTHGISPKVLDRANVIECDKVDFDRFLFAGDGERDESPFELPPARTATLKLGRIELGTQEITRELADRLTPLLELNHVLADVKRHFGYRVLNEIALFVRNARDLIGNGDDVIDAALDIQILQKVLPKFLFGPMIDAETCAEVLRLCRGDGPAPRFPRTAERLAQLLVERGAVSRTTL
jgi:hypothetical protein